MNVLRAPARFVGGAIVRDNLLSPHQRACRIFKRKYEAHIASYLVGVAAFRAQLDDFTVSRLEPCNPYERDTPLAHAWTFGWEDAQAGVITSSTGLAGARAVPLTRRAGRITVVTLVR